MMIKYTSIFLSLLFLISCQPTKEDLKKEYRQAYKLQQEALQISKRVDGKFNQTKYMIGELAKTGFQNPAVLDIMNRFTVVEKNYNDWKKNTLAIPGYGTGTDKASLKDAPSPKEAAQEVQSSLNKVQEIYKEIQAIYILADN